MTDQTHFWALLLAAEAAEAALKSSSRSSGPHRGLKLHHAKLIAEPMGAAWIQVT